MEIEPANTAEPGADQDIRRIAGKARPCDAVLHDIEGFHHHGRQPGPAAAPEELPAQRPLAAEHPAKAVDLRELRSDLVFVGTMICDDRATAEQVGIEIDRDHQSRAESAGGGNWHRIYQRAVD